MQLTLAFKSNQCNWW